MNPSDSHHKIGRSNCDPLWVQHRFLADGHDVTTDNGTATFIKFGGRHFICTCAHVIEAAQGDLIPSMMVGRAVINFANFDAGQTYRHVFRFPDRANLDIAIAPLTDFHWSLFQEKKEKAPIDLDAWREPEWPAEATLVAAGYLNERKYATDEKIATPLVLAVAELASLIGAKYPTFALSSLLDEPHGVVFSGISGGPVYLPTSDDEMVPLGITFEGGPRRCGRIEGLLTILV